MVTITIAKQQQKSLSVRQYIMIKTIIMYGCYFMVLNRWQEKPSFVDELNIINKIFFLCNLIFFNFLFFRVAKKMIIFSESRITKKKTNRSFEMFFLFFPGSFFAACLHVCFSPETLRVRNPFCQNGQKKN